MWPEAEETAGLLKRVENSDPGAADRLWERHRAPLRKLIGFRIDPRLARRVDASDVVQEVLLNASRRLGDYLHDPQIPFHLWLRRIANDHLVDEHRRHRLSAKRTLDRERSFTASDYAESSSCDLAAMLLDHELTPAAASIRAELEERFRRAIAELNEDDREIILLRHFEQLSNSETARALGLSEPAAGMRYLRALRKLRAILGESESLGGPRP